jgi:hypothetical protein
VHERVEFEKYVVEAQQLQADSICQPNPNPNPNLTLTLTLTLTLIRTLTLP